MRLRPANSPVTIGLKITLSPYLLGGMHSSAIFVYRMGANCEYRRAARWLLPGGYRSETSAIQSSGENVEYLTTRSHRLEPQVKCTPIADDCNQVEEILNDLSPLDQTRLLGAMRTIEELLGTSLKDEKISYILRPPHAGDMGWVVQSNGFLYAQEYGWDETYEALVAQIVADFVKNYDAKKERCWIAEKEGENIACVFLVRESNEVARLRLLIVDPKARGLGLGKRLVDECTRFARQAGYKKIVLWTNSVLLAARGIYEKAGYKLVKAEKHHSFGHELIGETWELDLS